MNTQKALLLGLLLAQPLATARAAELVPSDGAANDNFGWVVSSDLNSALIGSRQDDDAGLNSGSAYLFRDLNTASGTTTETAKLVASDATPGAQFGFSVSFDNTWGLVSNGVSGLSKGYLFRNLDTASGTITETAQLQTTAGGTFNGGVSLDQSIGLIGQYSSPSAGVEAVNVFRGLGSATGTVTPDLILQASDNGANDSFGRFLSLSNTYALVAADQDDDAGTNSGSVYLFSGLDTATGTLTESAKLVASDAAAGDHFGWSTTIEGSRTGLIGTGASDAEFAYFYKDLHTASGTITEDLKLTASDVSAGDYFGFASHLSGETAVVGAFGEDGVGSNTGAAYFFRRDFTSFTGTVTEDVKIFASDAAAGDNFGWSTSLHADSDGFVIGAQGANSGEGKAYTGRVSTFMTFDLGTESTDGLSFVSQGDWVIGSASSGNQITLSNGDTGDVTQSGHTVIIGQNANANSNRLIIESGATLTATLVEAGNGTTNSGNILEIQGDLVGDATANAQSGVGGGGRIDGDLTIVTNGKFLFDPTLTLSVSTGVDLASTFGVDDLLELGSSISAGEYTFLLSESSVDFDAFGLENWGDTDTYDLGSGKEAYFREDTSGSSTSLILVVVPEPSVTLLGGLSLLGLLRRRRA